MKLTSALFVTLVTCSCSEHESAATPSSLQDERMSEATVVEAALHKAEIATELATLGTQHPWAGQYSRAEIFSHEELLIAPQSGFVAHSSGCVVTEPRDWGSVSEHDGILKLTPHFPVDKSVRFDDELLPVRWGERRYLVALDHIKDFANDINAGEGCDALLRVGDDKSVPSGTVQASQQYAALFLDEPLSARVTAVAEPRYANDQRARRRLTIVTLDIGAKNGAWKGMTLHRPDIEAHGVLTITKVEESTSKAELEDWHADGPVPEIGWLVSTRR